jgi:hypothetical protein
MTTREKIIVGIMCLTVLYGAYDLFVYRNKPKYKASTPTSNPIVELKSFVAEVTRKLVSEKVSDQHRYMIEKSGENWTKDPFIPSIEPLRKQLVRNDTPQKPSVPQSPTGFIFTGFLKIGDKRFAVINDMEYSVGEQLDPNGLYVKSISPQYVVIGKINGPETIQLPLKELDPGLGKKTR